MTASSEPPLTGVRVLDLTDGRGETAARFLADLGADVIRVEPPAGSASRTREPVVDGVSLYYTTHNANKRAVTIDRGDEGGRGDFARLVDTADIVVVSDPDDEPEQLMAGRPSLVVLAVTDFGLTGPYRSWHGDDAIFQALSGSLSRSGLPGREPLLPPAPIAVEAACAQAAWAALVAYYNRLETGRGDLVDVSLFEAVMRVIDPGFGMGGSATGGVSLALGPRGRPDARHMYPIFPCADGWVRICVLAPRQWQGMFRWLGEPAELSDPGLASLGKRFAAAAQIHGAIAELFATRTRDRIVEEGQSFGVPTAALLSPTEVMAAEQFAERGAFIELPVSESLTVRAPNGFLEVDGARAGLRTSAPAPGEHTGEVLAGLPVAAPVAAPVTAAGPPTLPLAGLRVLDLGVIVVGAELGRLFGDLGAEVIKVENRAFPDGSRQSFDGALVSPGVAVGHRNKQSVGLNLRSPEGVALFKRLVAVSDVVVSNFKPGTMNSLGLSYAELAAVNPRVVVADSSAFGSTGPWSRRMGYGPLVRASSGLSGLWRYPDDEGGFSDASTIYPDHVAARIEATAVLAKLLQRRRTGRGGTVSVAQAEVLLGHLSTELAHESVVPGQLVPVGNSAPGDAPSGLYPCAGDDEWCVVSIRGDGDFQRLAELLGVPGGARFTSAVERVAHRSELDELVAGWTRARAPRAAMEELQAAGVPAGMMQRVVDLPADPHLVARGFFREMKHPMIADALLGERTTAHFRAVADPPDRPAPVAGQHSREVLRRVLELSDAELDRLVAAGVVEEPDDAGQRV